MPLVLTVSLYYCTVNLLIAHRERIAHATVTMHDESNHGRDHYQFVLNGAAYEGWAYRGHTSPKVGEQISVFYDPTNPSQNSYEDFSDTAVHSLFFVPFLLLAFALAVFRIHRRRRRMRIYEASLRH